MIDKDKAREHFERGEQLAWVKGKWEAALKEYRAALEACPTSAATHWRIGQVHFFAEKPRLDEALNAFREAVRIEPEWCEGHFWSAGVLEEMGRLEEAIEAYQRAVQADPDDPRNPIALGACLGKARRYAEAIPAFQRGLALEPDYGEINARMMLADALKEFGRLREAVREWKTVAEMPATWDYEEGEPQRAQALLDEFAQS